MKRITKIWLSVWTYVITLIAGVIIGALFFNWDDWSFQTKIFAFATALLPLHVLEEWFFPGGFHTMYNLMQNSDTPDRYPMNMLSDMWTNLIGVIFGCIVLTVGVNPIFMIMQLFLCCAEIFGHTSGGIFSYKKFKDKGKKPSIVLAHLPLGSDICPLLFVLSFHSLSNRHLQFGSIRLDFFAALLSVDFH